MPKPAKKKKFKISANLWSNCKTVVEVNVRKNNRQFGRLYIQDGAMYWTKTRKWTHKRIGWDRFSSIMEG